MSSRALRLREARCLRALLLAFSLLLLRCAFRRTASSETLKRLETHRHILRYHSGMGIRMTMPTTFRELFLHVPGRSCRFPAKQLPCSCPEAAKGLSCLRLTALPERTPSDGVPWPAGELLLLNAAAAAAPGLAAPAKCGVLAWLLPRMPSNLRACMNP